MVGKINPELIDLPPGVYIIDNLDVRKVANFEPIKTLITVLILAGFGIAIVNPKLGVVCNYNES